MKGSAVMDLRELNALEAAPEAARRHPWEQARARLVTDTFLQRFPVATGRVLDVGCGDGFILSEVVRAYPALTGVGVDTEFRGVASAAGVQIVPNLRDVPDGPVSVLLLMDVLEHVEHPLQLLQQIQAGGWLTAETRVLVTVPAWQFLFSEHDRWLGHYRRYRRNELQRLLQNAGFQVEESGYWFTSLFCVRALERTLERLGWWKRQATGLVEWQGGVLLSGWIRDFLVLEARLAMALSRGSGWCPPGLTCYAVARSRSAP